MPADSATDSMSPDAGDGAPDAPGDVDSGGAGSCQLPAELPAAAGNFERHTYAGAEGTRDYWLYVPSTYAADTPHPLVVMIHGCTQTAEELAAATEYGRVAEAAGVLVVFPDQSLLANTMGCWNWFAPAHQQRDQGEPALIVGIVEEIAQGWSVDPQRIYMGGFSAGASMALVMAATYPDRFAAVASFAGCPFQGACLGLESADTLVQSLLSAMGAQARYVPIFVANGTADAIVSPAANQAVIEQWLGAADRLDDGAANHSVPSAPAEVLSLSENGLDYQHSVFVNSFGSRLAERLVVEGLGHAWCGGSEEESYSTEQGPNLGRETYRFFCEHPLAVP